MAESTIKKYTSGDYVNLGSYATETVTIDISSYSYLILMLRTASVKSIVNSTIVPMAAYNNSSSNNPIRCTFYDGTNLHYAYMYKSNDTQTGFTLSSSSYEASLFGVKK